MRGLRTSGHVVVLVVVGVLCAALTGAAAGLALHHRPSTSTTISDPDPVDSISRAVPRRVATIPLFDQQGRRTDLAAFHGRVVVLADFMTSCQEECPITTGALLTLRREIDSAHLQNRVDIVEATVDPWRDHPERLAAYARTFGVPWPLLTGSRSAIAALWSWFGVYYQRVKEGKPPDINWQTGKPYTFDIVHSDDVFILGPSGAEQALVQGNADLDGRLPADLHRLLSAQGRHDLRSPGAGAWTPGELLRGVESVLHADGSAAS